MTNKQKTKHYLNLCIKSITGNTNKDEDELLKKWLNESDENKSEYNNIKKIWDLTSLYEDAQLPDAENEWRELSGITEPADSKAKIRAASRNIGNKKFKPAFKPVLAAALAVLILAAVVLIWNKTHYVPAEEIVLTADKAQKEIRLPDGSTVILNGRSTIRYPETFYGNIREVKLKGEAFFKVTKQEHPFVVSTVNARTTVVGTQFDVWSRGGDTKVIVKKGIVKVTPKISGEKSVRLTANQRSTVIGDQSPTNPEDVNAGFLLGWMQGNLVFDKTPLLSIAGELEKYYNVPIEVTGKKLEEITLTGSFRNMSADSALSMICLALDLKYVKQHGKYIIKSK